jgi:hypothetical protein
VLPSRHGKRSKSRGGVTARSLGLERMLHEILTLQHWRGQIADCARPTTGKSGTPLAIKKAPGAFAGGFVVRTDYQ